MKTLTGFLIILVCILSACHSPQSATNESKLSANGSTQGNDRPETRRRMQVIFYTPSSDELGKEADAGGDMDGIMTTVSDFEQYATAFGDSSGIPGLEIRFSDSPIIELIQEDGSVFSLKRDNGEHKMGAVFFDGIQEPKVTSGIYVTEEYRKMAKDYFGIK